MDGQELIQRGVFDPDSSADMGALLLSNGCKVIHVPTYLKGLWDACQDIAPQQGDSVAWSTPHQKLSDCWEKEYLGQFDTVVLCAGSGLFMDGILQDSSNFPIQLVRGQSVEFSFPTEKIAVQPVLCGKYVAPLSSSPHLRVVVGATHEYERLPLNSDDVLKELQESTMSMCPQLWKHGTIDRITHGYRVQSKRGQHGRLPIVGKVSAPSISNDCWIFTGLSSRGLIYHGVFGGLLSSAIINRSDNNLSKWWT
jgi:glycine/D-amino acid oxidase-like deaminating enzyme